MTTILRLSDILSVADNTKFIRHYFGLPRFPMSMKLTTADVDKTWYKCLFEDISPCRMNVVLSEYQPRNPPLRDCLIR